MLKTMFKALRRSPLGKNRLLTALYRELVVRAHRSQDARVGEFVVRFDARDRLIAGKLIVDGGYEQAEIAALCNLIEPGDVVLDVGANIGLYSLPMSRAVGRAGVVVAAEPDPDNVKLLRHNLEVNGCSNVIVVPCGFDDHDGSRSLFQVDDNRGCLSFADLCSTANALTVPVRRADSVLRELGLKAPALAKIDVEGAEPLVLAGLGCLPKYLQLEFVPAQLRALSVDPRGFLDQLVSDGYSIYLIDPETAAHRPMDAAGLARLAGSTGIDHNLLAVLASEEGADSPSPPIATAARRTRRPRRT